MRTAMHPTSLAAYRYIEPELSGRRREVMLRAHTDFTGKTFTRKQLARALGWEINRVTGRVLELIDMGYLNECGTTVEDGRSASLLEITPAQSRLFV